MSRLAHVAPPMTHTLLQIAVATNAALGIIAVVCDSLAVKQASRQRDDREAALAQFARTAMPPPDKAAACRHYYCVINHRCLRKHDCKSVVERVKANVAHSTDPKWAAQCIADAEGR